LRDQASELRTRAQAACATAQAARSGARAHRAMCPEWKTVDSVVLLQSRDRQWFRCCRCQLEFTESEPID